MYIAGPDVFCINAKEAGELLKHKCYKYGFKGLFPLDNTLEAILFNNLGTVQKSLIITKRILSTTCFLVTIVI